MITPRDEFFMWECIKEAQKAFDEDEVPVGALIVCEDKIISSAHNTRENDKNALHHAEIKVIDAACRALGGWRLVGCTLYVTLEPCPMCAGAIINSRVERVVYGAYDKKSGAFGTMLDLTLYPVYKPEICGGILEEKCSALLSDFFKTKRDKGTLPVS